MGPYFKAFPPAVGVPPRQWERGIGGEAGGVALRPGRGKIQTPPLPLPLEGRGVKKGEVAAMRPLFLTSSKSVTTQPFSSKLGWRSLLRLLCRRKVKDNYKITSFSRENAAFAAFAARFLTPYAPYG